MGVPPVIGVRSSDLVKVDGNFTLKEEECVVDDNQIDCDVVDDNDTCIVNDVTEVENVMQEDDRCNNAMVVYKGDEKVMADNSGVMVEDILDACCETSNSGDVFGMVTNRVQLKSLNVERLRYMKSIRMHELIKHRLFEKMKVFFLLNEGLMMALGFLLPRNLRKICLSLLLLTLIRGKMWLL